MLDRADWTTFIPSPTDSSLLVFLSALLNIFGLSNDNLDNHRLTFSNEITLIAW